MKQADTTGIETIRIESGLLSTSLINKLRHYQLPGQGADDYGIEKGLRLNDELGRYWRIAQARWEAFCELRQRGDLDQTQLTIDEWLLPLLTRVLGYDVVPLQPAQIGERLFPIDHSACFGAAPMVLTGPAMALDQGDPRFGQEGNKRSPSGLLQEYLNAEPRCQWGLVSNGLVLRLLRDNPAMTRPAYVEVDLERLFNEGLYADFTVVWLLLHASRMRPQDETPESCYLELWRGQGQTDGERALGELRHGVTEALRQLGSGFVSHPANTALRAALQSGELTTERFFQELLRLVYRFLFLLTAEDRNILLDPEAAPEAKTLYQQGYSLSRLRDRARQRRFHDQHHDAWQQLLITFAGFANGQLRLGQPALGGLFAGEQCPHLEQAELDNRSLYQALFKIGFFESNRVLVRINYRDMDTEELGSVYESLLELVPQLSVNGRWHFGFVGDDDNRADTSGHARKLTGSYYTPDALVQELIASALIPVIEQRLQKHPSNPRNTLLNISVCDPACGSGHFLLAAARRLATELARIDAGADQPTEADYRRALREVVRHCIYGVDVNPLAVELCKTALWLETLEPGKPLGFLDAHIQVGNSLIGLLTPDLLADGIPDDAYKALTGDDKATVSALKRRNKMDKRQRELLAAHVPDLRVCAGSVAAMPEDSLADVEEKRYAWQALVNSPSCQDEKLRADVFTAAFFAAKTCDDAERVPTNVELAALEQSEQIDPKVREYVATLSGEHRFFHWYLGFPEVFERGGFDVMLGNPPWERIKLQEKEFFAARHSKIANASKTATRVRMINALADGDDVDRALFREFIAAKQSAEASSAFARNSGRFPLTGKGDVNLYALFAEHFSQAINRRGCAGGIFPTGIATDDSTKAYFASLTHERRLASLFSFENEEFIFRSVHHAYRFCILTLSNIQPDQLAKFVFFARQAYQIHEPARQFRLAQSDIDLINPNTKTCPIFRSERDAELTKKLYRAAPVLIREATEDEPEHNPWGIRFQAMFHMSSDSVLFHTYKELQELGAVVDGRAWQHGQDRYVPLYEAKMIHHYDHRWATYETDGETSRDCTLAEKQNPSYQNLPRYWVNEWEVTLRTTRAPDDLVKACKKADEDAIRAALYCWAAGHALNQGFDEDAEFLLPVNPRDNQPMINLFNDDNNVTRNYASELEERYPLIEEEYECLRDSLLGGDEADQVSLGQQVKSLLEVRRPKYLLGWRDICRSTDERTVIAGVLPLAAVGDTFLLMFPGHVDSFRVACLVADQNSLVHDFVARQKVGGTHLKYHVKKQIVNLPPERYSLDDLDFIVSRVLELTYTAYDLKPFAEDLGYHGEPFLFNPERRLQLRCELDAYYAKLYGLTRDELRYILDPSDVMGADYPSESFRVLKNREMAEFGEYRTQRLVLEAWDNLCH